MRRKCVGEGGRGAAGERGAEKAAGGTAGGGAERGKCAWPGPPNDDPRAAPRTPRRAATDRAWPAAEPVCGVGRDGLYTPRPHGHYRRRSRRELLTLLTLRPTAHARHHGPMAITVGARAGNY